MSEDIETLMQRIETLQQERDAAQRANAEMRYALEGVHIHFTHDRHDAPCVLCDQMSRALSSESGKGWHSPEEWEGLQKAITEMRQRIATCHDRLLRGDTDPELLKLLEGSWGPPSGAGITVEKT